MNSWLSCETSLEQSKTRFWVPDATHQCQALPQASLGGLPRARIQQSCRPVVMAGPLLGRQAADLLTKVAAALPQASCIMTTRFVLYVAGSILASMGYHTSRACVELAFALGGQKRHVGAVPRRRSVPHGRGDGQAGGHGGAVGIQRAVGRRGEGAEGHHVRAGVVAGLCDARRGS